MNCDLKSSVLQVLFRLCFFPHSFNKYLTRARDAHSALFWGCYEIRPFPVFRGLTGSGEREKWLLISHISESLIPNNDYKAETRSPLSFNTGYDLDRGAMGVSAGKTPPKKVLCKQGQGEEEPSGQRKFHGDKSLR